MEPKHLCRLIDSLCDFKYGRPKPLVCPRSLNYVDQHLHELYLNAIHFERNHQVKVIDPLNNHPPRVPRFRKKQVLLRHTQMLRPTILAFALLLLLCCFCFVAFARLYNHQPDPVPTAYSSFSSLPVTRGIFNMYDFIFLFVSEITVL